LVRTLVNIRTEELADYITVRGMEFHAPEARLFNTLRGTHKIFYQLINFYQGQSPCACFSVIRWANGLHVDLLPGRTHPSMV